MHACTLRKEGCLHLGALAAAAESLQSCPTLGDPMDCGLPGSSNHRIFQARILEWVAISFSTLVKHLSKFKNIFWEKIILPSGTLAVLLQIEAEWSSVKIRV